MTVDRHRQCGWCRLPTALAPYRQTHIWVHTTTGQPVCDDGTRRNCNTLAPRDRDRPVVYFADASLSDDDRSALLHNLVEAVEAASGWRADANRHDQLHWQDQAHHSRHRDIAEDYRRSAEREIGRATGLIQWYAHVYDSRDARALADRLDRVVQRDAALADIIGDLHLLDLDEERS